MNKTRIITAVALMALAVYLAILVFSNTIVSNPEIILLILAGAAILSASIITKFIREFIGIENNSRKLSEKNTLLEKVIYEQQHMITGLFNNTNEGIALLDLEGNIHRVNQGICNLFGYSEKELLMKNYFSLSHVVQQKDLQSRQQELLDNKIHSIRDEYQLYRNNGEIVWVIAVLSLLRDQNSNPTAYLVQLENITQQKKAENRLHHMAYHDALTGLANRNKLEQFANHIIASSRRQQTGFAILFLDIDHFKKINDSIGHEAGDTLLQIVAERLRSIIRTTDIVARLGGDEFILLLTDVKRTESLAIIAKKVLDCVMQAILIKGQQIYITGSIGISLYPYDGQTMQALLTNADLALYRAKEHGRNNYQFYTIEMTSKVQDKLSLQNALGHALAKNEFLLHYQPKMELSSRTITGVEALIRWKNTDFGAITPDEMIALAEETGLIIPVSEWVLRTACKQLKSWHAMGFTNLTMAVNCSQRQFKQVSFVDDIMNMLTRLHLSPQSLEIEIKEKTIMDDPENTLRVLYALKDLGIKIVIDDFGTGYWSLAHLRRLSVDKIKIDRTFIKQIILDESSTAITTAIIAMANKLDICSIAEGVETKEQYDFLVKEGCREIQGYYLSRPLEEEAISNFLKNPIPALETKTEA